MYILLSSRQLRCVQLYALVVNVTLSDRTGLAPLSNKFDVILALGVELNC